MKVHTSYPLFLTPPKISTTFQVLLSMFKLLVSYYIEALTTLAFVPKFCWWLNFWEECYVWLLLEAAMQFSHPSSLTPPLTLLRTAPPCDLYQKTEIFVIKKKRKKKDYWVSDLCLLKLGCRGSSLMMYIVLYVCNIFILLCIVVSLLEQNFDYYVFFWWDCSWDPCFAVFYCIF